MNRSGLSPIIFGLVCVLFSAGMVVYFTLSPNEPEQAVTAHTAPLTELLETIPLGASPTFVPVRVERGAAISASAISDSGVLALFREDGTLHVFNPSSRNPDLRISDAYARAVAWHGTTLYAVSGGLTPTLSRWQFNQDAAEPEAAAPQAANWAFAGDPKDLWISPDGSLAWILVRDQETDAILTIQLGTTQVGDAPEFASEHMRTPIGAAPVGFFPGQGNTVIAPSFMGRHLAVFNANEPVQPTIIPVDIRPIFATQGDGPRGPMTIALAANTPQIVTVTRDVASVHATTAPMSYARIVEDGVVAFSAENGQLFRLNFDMTVAAVSDHLQLVTDMERLSNGLLIATDAGPKPTVSIVDPETLESRGSVTAEGRPGRILIHRDTVTVVSPSEGVAATWLLHP